MKARKHAFVKQLIEACVYDTSRNFFFIFQHSISLLHMLRHASEDIST